jgi:hypothetical protein
LSSAQVAVRRYLCVGLPVFSRDFLFNAFGADCMVEHGKVVILGKSVDAHPTKAVPWKATGWLHKRMDVQDIEAIVEAISPTAAKVRDLRAVDCLSLATSDTRANCGDCTKYGCCVYVTCPLIP